MWQRPNGKASCIRVIWIILWVRWYTNKHPYSPTVNYNRSWFESVQTDTLQTINWRMPKWSVSYLQTRLLDQAVHVFSLAVQQRTRQAHLSPTADSNRSKHSQHEPTSVTCPSLDHTCMQCTAVAVVCWHCNRALDLWQVAGLLSHNIGQLGLASLRGR